MRVLTGTARSVDWKERGSVVLRAVIVVLCYLIVFAGLLYTVAGSASP